MLYCTCTEVESYLRSYGMQAGSPGAPTPAEITVICEQITAELNSILTGAQINIEALNATHINLLKSKAVLGASVEVLDRMNVETDQTALLLAQWSDFKTQIFSHPAIFQASDTGAEPAYYSQVATDTKSMFTMEKRSW